MAKDKKGFILYADQKELFDTLTEEQAGKLIKHIFAYVNDESPESDDVLTKLAFIPIKQQLKRDLKKFEATKKSRSDAGKKGMESRWKDNKAITKDNSVIPAITKITDNVNVTVKDTVKVKDNVILNKSEIKTLKDKHGLKGYEWMLDKLSNYKLASGKTYKSDYGAINSWVVKEWVKIKSVSSEAQFQSPIL